MGGSNELVQSHWLVKELILEQHRYTHPSHKDMIYNSDVLRVGEIGCVSALRWTTGGTVNEHVMP